MFHDILVKWNAWHVVAGKCRPLSFILNHLVSWRILKDSFPQPSFLPLLQIGQKTTTERGTLERSTNLYALKKQALQGSNVRKSEKINS